MRTPALVAALFLAACGTPQSPPPGPGTAGGSGAAGGSTMAETDAGTDAGVQPLPDAGSACDGNQPCNLSWTEGPSYPVDVDHHSTFVMTSAAGTFLYVAGGLNNNTMLLHDTVRRAPIQADGSLGAWVDCSKLPIVLGFHGYAQKGKHVYLLAGISQDAQGPFGHDLSFIGTLQDDGDITWVQNANRLRMAALHGTGAIVGDTLYFFGGTGAGNAPQALVKQAKIKADGTLDPWADAPSLPLQRSHHVAVVHDGHIFVAGGFDTGQNPISAVLRSSFDANGMLTGWAVVGEIDSSPWTSAGVAYRGHLFLIGGGEGGPGSEHYVNRVRRAKFDGEGALTPFIDVDTLPTERAHVHQAPLFGDRVYSVGGRRQVGAGQSIARVFVGKFGGGSQ